MVQTFRTGPIHQTTGMEIVKEGHHALMQPLHNGSDCSKPLFGIETTYIIPMNVINGVAHLPPLPLQSDSTRCYLNIID
jgi:hypothetical protein